MEQAVSERRMRVIPATKPAPRFARNTVDCLKVIRALKVRGIGVIFEKENIYMLDAKGEVMITIMSSLTQEESRSISENVTWGKHRSIEEGKICLGYKHFLGYEKGEDGLPRIVEEQAEIVRRIYSNFLEGYTVRAIADQLTEEGIPTPAGKSKWSVSTIMSILQNEKYKGDALLHVGTEILIRQVSRFLSLLSCQNGYFRRIFVHFLKKRSRSQVLCPTCRSVFLRRTDFANIGGAKL